MFWRKRRRTAIPIGVMRDASNTTYFLPALSMKLVNTKLPIEKEIKLITPISPITYGSEHTRSSYVIQLFKEYWLFQSILYDPPFYFVKHASSAEQN